MRRWRGRPELGAVMACIAFGTSAETVPETVPETAWPIPRQLGPTDAEGARRDSAEVVRLPGYGFVRGTPEALKDVYRPLVDVPGRNEAVEPCRRIVEKAAVPLGAISVEAVSAGAQSRMGQGQAEAPVSVRVTYARDEFRLDYEVRLAILRCRVDRKGTVSSATVQEDRAQ